MQTGYKVMDAMTKMPISVNSSTSVEDCAKLMDKNDIGSLLVMDGVKVSGVITEQDLVRRVLAKDGIPSRMHASEIMSENIISVSPQIDIYDALMTMNRFNVRHTPVLANGEFVGFLTLKDILKIEPDLFDLIVDKFQLREEDQKPIHNQIRIIE